jgi:hypothetical protein
VKNDGQVPTAWLIQSSRGKPSTVDANLPPDASLSDALILENSASSSSIFNRKFQAATSTTFDPIAAAEAAVNITFTYLLNEERAARLIEYNARDSKQPFWQCLIS